MQVMLNLVSNASDAVEQLAREEQWIRLSISLDQGKTIIRCANGGPALTKEIAESMLQDSGAAKSKKGFGLGLGISLRLIQKAHGILEINTAAAHPDIVIVLASRPIETLKLSG